MQRIDPYFGLESVIERAINDACTEGLGYTGQTGNAVRMIQKAHPDMSAFEAMRLVDLYRAEN